MQSLPLFTPSFVRRDGKAKPSALPLSPDSARTLTVRLAIDPATRAAAFAIRYKAYAENGYIDERMDAAFSDRDDELPNAHTVVIYKNGRPAASARFCILDSDPAAIGWSEIPALRIFPEEVKALVDTANQDPERIGRGPARAVEINRLVRDPEFKDDFELVFALFRVGTYIVLHYDADILLSCVRKNHMPFYRRLIKLQTIAGPRRYAGVKFESYLMACGRTEAHAILRDVPIFNSAKVINGGFDPLFDGETVTVFGED